MDENLTVAELSKLAGTKTEAILAGLQAIAKRAKSGTKEVGARLTGANVKAEKAAVESAREAKSAIPKAGGKNARKANAKKHKELQTKIDQGPKAIADAERKSRNARLVAGGTAAALGIAGIAKAMKRGSKAAPMLGKKDKLIKAMKKNPKTTAAVAGGTGAVGLASLLKDK